ncbi:MAG: hypothetical protein AB8G05_17415 [Oligoflexales bacterium]
MKSVIFAATYLIFSACGDKTLMHPEQQAADNGINTEEKRGEFSAEAPVILKSKRVTQEILAPKSDTREILASKESTKNPTEVSEPSKNMDMDQGSEIEEGEDVLEPILVNGAALTCHSGEPDTLYCMLNNSKAESYNWQLYHGTGEPVEENLYEVQEIENQEHWNVRIKLLESITNIKAEASTQYMNANGIAETHIQTSELLSMDTSLSIHEKLSRVYESSEYGDLTLAIDVNNGVLGSWVDGDIVGDVAGTFFPETMSIEGRWIEHLPDSQYEGDFVFKFTLSADGIITVSGEYTNDGSSDVKSWPLTPKPL